VRNRRRHDRLLIDDLAQRDLDDRGRDHEHHPKGHGFNHVGNGTADNDLGSSHHGGPDNRGADRSSDTSTNCSTNASSLRASDTGPDGATTAEL